jgi:outer membrane protein assembly factor BamB
MTGGALAVLAPLAVLAMPSSCAAGPPRRWTTLAAPMTGRGSGMLQRLATILVLSVGWAAEPAQAVVVAAPGPLAAQAVVEDWPAFLGPRHDGVSREHPINMRWDAAGPRLLWSIEHGTGYASPAVVSAPGPAHGRLVLTHRIGDADVVECLDPETGSRRWRQTFATDYQDRYGYNNGPRSSPVIAGDQVLCFSQTGVLRCLALADGATRWIRELNRDHQVAQGFFGVGTTPLITGDLVIVNVGGSACVVGLDLASGATRWTTADDWGASYASPVPAVLGGQRRVLLFVGGESRPPTGGLLAIDPLTGKSDLRFPWRSRSYESVNASCPVVVGERILVTASYQTGSALVQAIADGTTLSAKPLWTNPEAGCHFATPIHLDGNLYACIGRNHPDAELACIDLATGALRWHEQPRWTEQIAGREVAMSTFRAQMLRVDGHFLCLGEEGHLLCYDLTPTGMRELARCWLFQAPETWTAPVLWHGLLYVCQNHAGRDGTKPRLLCYDLRGR